MRTAVIGIIVLAGLCGGGGAAGARESDFDRNFTGKALRIDFYHTGTATEEVVSFDELLEEPYWAGNPANLIDTLGLGSYLVRVFDLGTNDLLFSKGFCSLFGEWRTTDEAIAGVHRTFHESIRMPYPRRPVQVRVEGRDHQNVFRTIADLVVDPADYHIERETRFGYLRVRDIMTSGDPARKVDIVILGDGYGPEELHKLRKDAERLTARLFDTEPFANRRRSFNVRLVESLSEETGVDNPRKGEYRVSALDFAFNAFDIDRYMLSASNRTIRDMAARAPYDAIIVLANSQKYGGGGIYDLYAVTTTDNEFTEYVLVHEFGHSFAGLGDEYFNSEVAYNDIYPRGVEPWEPNITALLDTTAVKWEDLIAKSVPVPTPDDSTYAGAVGCFEGAGYAAKGLYRAFRDCRMFSKGTAPFCPVCRRAIERVIDFYTE